MYKTAKTQHHAVLTFPLLVAPEAAVLQLADANRLYQQHSRSIHTPITSPAAALLAVKLLLLTLLLHTSRQIASLINI
jgi:hypothetical protein